MSSLLFVDALFWCDAIVYKVVSFTTVSTNWLSMTVASKVVAPERLTLSGPVGFVNQSGRAAAEKRPESLCRLQKGHKQILGQGVIRELSRRAYVNRREPGLDFYLVADDAVTIHLIAVKVGQFYRKG
ncbi:hypothetical protein FOWG_16892 [Fusarium oxysporum f. sp. lycopersici MN25]|uniref:Uncharacterized protein n=1 Tax=Fusarium oxysporum (strain Fo5176) TaxID=660025 RepID=A0A0C4DIL6_FUSOF|nr:hypothetical protein FOWG_16892 [Fusarium oxysporum f. sp. lycopersici MN25]